MQDGKDPGKFRQLDEILYVEGYPGYQQLMNVASHHMELVCEVKGIYCFGYSLPQTPLVWESLALGLPFTHSL
jgi:hypothetical protein